MVDDDEFNLAFVRSALPSPPLEVATAINGRAAVDTVRSNPVDVIFMDIEMPVMNGFDALAQIRALDSEAGRRPATVVAFSSYDDEAMRRRCREAGFDAYLGNPAARERIHEIPHAVAADYALTPDHDDRWRTGGSVEQIVAESHLDPESIREAVLRFVRDRAERHERMRELLGAAAEIEGVAGA